MTACKVRIRIDTSFIAFLCAYYFINPMLTFWPFLLSASFHELGHLLAMHLCNVKVHMLQLRASGAVIHTETMPYWKEAAVAATGPAVNLILLLAAVQRKPLLAVINLCLFVYNLLPIYPLDGGRFLRAMLHMLLPTNIVDAFEQIIQLCCLGTILVFSCYMTCVLRAGLWPVILTCALFMRVMEMILTQKRKKSL